MTEGSEVTDAAAPHLLEMRGITKQFPGVLANDAVDFDLAAGEVHTLLGRTERARARS